MVGVFPEDVPNDDGCFLHNITDFGGNQLEEGVDASAGGRFNFDGELADCADRFADKVDVDFSGISRRVSELRENR